MIFVEDNDRLIGDIFFSYYIFFVSFVGKHIHRCINKLTKLKKFNNNIDICLICGNFLYLLSF
jgi:hypothetical protein